MRGAAVSLLDNLRRAVEWRSIRVHDRCVLALARLKRRRLKDTVFVGITGSAGKTTTKDLAVAILRRLGPVSCNHASLNYLPEVGMVILNTRGRDHFSVIEIATLLPGDIACKTELVQPKIGALTVVQREHVKSFESIEAIADEKAAMILALPENGVAVLNIDDPLVQSIGARTRARCLWFGSAPQADIRLIEATSSWPDPLTLVIEYQGVQYRCATAIHGKHLVVPVLAAIGIGIAAGAPIETCLAALGDATTTPGRMQIVSESDGVTFIRDDYKAPYWSFPITLEYLRDARAKRKVAIIGTISDYSLSASKLYPKAARLAMDVADLVVFVGPHALRALKARQSEDDHSLVGFTELEDAHRFLQRELREGDLVLLKASNHADHLFRLLLARRRQVLCWRRDCGFNRFCDACPELDKPAHGANVATASVVASGITTGPDIASPGIGSPAHSSESVHPGWLIVGMGNHGEAYTGTPHNIGFAVLDHLAERLSAQWQMTDEGMLSHAKLNDHEVILFKPSTLTNLCGPFVARTLQRFGVHPNRIALVHDDADLNLGDVRSKHSGSDGGHKGLRSVFSALGNGGAISRIRVGVRKTDRAGSSARSIVLERFQEEDHDLLRSAQTKAIEQVQTVIANGGR